MKLPRYLFHGTPAKNVDSICQRGILRGNVERCGAISHDAGFVSDCVGNVSLSTRERDAIFFAMAHGEHSAPQAIFKIDRTKLPKIGTSLLEAKHNASCYRRDLFEEEQAEIKCFSDIPPTAISSIHIRRFSQNGRLKAHNYYRKCERGKKCPVCHRYIRQKDPRRSLPGNPEKHHHGYAGATHD